QTRTRLQSLGLLGRAFQAATDEELDAMVAALDEDHRDALTELGATDAASVRTAAAEGRIDGTMESLAVVLVDACLADCIEQLGDHADNPSSDELRDVLPGIIERHGVAETRIMLASTVAGEANASAIIRDLLKSDDDVKLPPAEEPPVVVFERHRDDDDPDRQALLARRREQRKAKQDAARVRREQSRQDRSKT
ncbi:MAG: hypothetical protein M3501_12660, partial [Actinomycetota bacterium]|nr:hypothetical protein [Actinomycetota bacterium]